MVWILPLFFGCRSVPFDPETHHGDLVVIGDGGGITGIETRYFFTESGMVYRQTGFDTTFVKLPPVKPAIVQQVIESAEKLDLINYHYQQPGNVYKFLQLKIAGKENRIVWRSDSDGVSPACTGLYHLLNESLKAKM
jgi:hypothetical protein